MYVASGLSFCLPAYKAVVTWKVLKLELRTLPEYDEYHRNTYTLWNISHGSTNFIRAILSWKNSASIMPLVNFADRADRAKNECFVGGLCERLS